MSNAVSVRHKFIIRICVFYCTVLSCIFTCKVIVEGFYPELYVFLQETDVAAVFRSELLAIICTK